MKNNKRSVIRRRALRVEQDPKHPLFLFTLTPDELFQIADTSRVTRDETGKLIGYQRPEVKRHVKNIVEYLDSGEVLFPNSIILALSSSTEFKQVRGPKVDQGLADAGTLEIVVPREGQRKPAWIVDGQQRGLALERCKRRNFPVPISAFIADDVDTQRDQFLRVNSTKPLPRGLISELLPDVSTILPANLAARKTPSAVCELLNTDPESPFRGLIRRSSTKAADRERAVLSDTSIIQMLHESFTAASGCLFPYRNVATGETDFESVRKILLIYWGAVRDTFPEAWGLSPKKSRLMHSAGMRAMGRLMDRLMGSLNINEGRTPKVVRDELNRLRPLCHWTEGTWDEMGNIAWNDIQNVPGHIKNLSNFLIRAYLGGRRASA